MKKNKQELKTYFETGDKPTQGQYSDLIDSYIDAKQPSGAANRRFVIDKEGEVSVSSEQKISEYTLSEIVGNKLALLKDGVVVKEVDLTTYLDDTNLARLVSGTVDANGVATFKREDDSTFSVDFKPFIENVSTVGNTISASQGLSINDVSEDVELGGSSITKDVDINLDSKVKKNTLKIKNGSFPNCTIIESNRDFLKLNAQSDNPFTTINIKPESIKLNATSERGSQLIEITDRHIRLPHTHFTQIIHPKDIVTKEYVDTKSVGGSMGLPADFYEEGAFTPVLTTTGASYESNNAIGHYTRVGNLVTFQIYITNINTVGIPTGELLIGDFPFIIFNTLDIDRPTLAAYTTGGDVAYDNLITFTKSGEKFGLHNHSTGGTGSKSVYSAVTFTNGVFRLSGTYQTNVFKRSTF